MNLNLTARDRLGILYSVIAKAISLCSTTQLALEKFESRLTAEGGAGEGRLCSRKASEVPISAQAHFWAAVEYFYVGQSDIAA